MQKIFVIGGGILGMFAALWAKEFSKNVEVHLIESSERFGGLLSYLDCDGSRVDVGVHTLYETGVKSIDEELFANQPIGGWKVLSGIKRDLGGSIDSSGVNFGNQYLNPLHNEFTSTYTVSDFKKEIAKNRNSSASTFREMLINRFGEFLTTNIIVPYIERFSGSSIDNTSSIVTNHLPISRINLGNIDEYMSTVRHNEELRDRIAIPDQRTLPVELVPKRKAYYPSVYGTYKFIEALEKKLRASGIILHLKTTCQLMPNLKIQIENIPIPIKYDYVISTLPIQSNFRFLGIPLHVPNIAKKTFIGTIFTNEEPKVKDLYYVYDQRKTTQLHRIGFPHNYCNNITGNYPYLISCEYLIEDHDNLTKSQLICDLTSSGIIENIQEKNIYIHKIQGGYPNPLRQSQIEIEKKQDEYHSLLSSRNVVHVGIGANNGLFLQYELLKYAHEKLKSVLEN